jgi:hypothetical protein
MLGRKLGTGCQLKYSDELLLSNMDTVNLLQRRIEGIAGGFILVPVLTKNAEESHEMIFNTNKMLHHASLETS